MEHVEFSRRIMSLAGQLEPGAGIATAKLDASDIIGKLGLVLYVRRAQAVLLTGFLMALAVWLALAVRVPSGIASLPIVLLGAAIISVAVRQAPYWMPSRTLAEGLIGVASHRFNDPATFVKRQRSDMLTVSNSMLSDLCEAIVLDSRKA